MDICITLEVIGVIGQGCWEQAGPLVLSVCYGFQLVCSECVHFNSFSRHFSGRPCFAVSVGDAELSTVPALQGLGASGSEMSCVLGKQKILLSHPERLDLLFVFFVFLSFLFIFVFCRGCPPV